MKEPVFITSIASVSALGDSQEKIWEAYKQQHRHFFSRESFGKEQAFGAFLPKETKSKLDDLRHSDPSLKDLDQTVIFALHTSRIAVGEAGWNKGEELGINIGSSRGATALFENYHREFVATGKTHTLTSPNTTLGNISSWVAQDLESSGPEISHSVTCSTGMHAVLNGIAWMQAGLSEKFLVGGSEAALTPFTIAQMRAMKIYANKNTEYPCQALNMKKTLNSMILGEGAAVACLEKLNSGNALAKIEGIGYATEKLQHSVSITREGTSFQKAMRMALKATDLTDIDAVVMHAPGTIKGDLSEVNAIKAVFGEALPAMTSNKWKLGHTFGASGMLSLEMAVLMLNHQEFIPVPFSEFQKKPKKLEKILVNSIGFGGNAVSLLVVKVTE